MSWCFVFKVGSNSIDYMTGMLCILHDSSTCRDTHSTADRVLSTFGGEAFYSAMNIIAYYGTTHCVGGLGEYLPANVLILRCL